MQEPGQMAEAAEAFVQAAGHGRLNEVVQGLATNSDLLNAKARVRYHWCTYREWTALQAASYGGRLSVAKLLVKRGADLDIEDEQGETALSLAAERRFGHMVPFLLESGARMDIRTVDGFTVMINAAASNHTDILEVLLAHGPQHVNDTDSEGCSALWWAARYGALHAAQMLLQAGADPFLPNDEGMTPRQAAYRYSRHKCYAPFKHIDRTLRLFKARRVYEDQARAQNLPTAPRPHYYRRDANAPLPALTLVSSNQTGAVKRRTPIAFEHEEERREVVEFTVKRLSDDLFRELLDGLRIMA